MPTTKKPAKKQVPLNAKTVKPAKAAAQGQPTASKLTWALALTFFVLSIVFVSQAYYYCYM